MMLLSILSKTELNEIKLAFLINNIVGDNIAKISNPQDNAPPMIKTLLKMK